MAIDWEKVAPTPATEIERHADKVTIRTDVGGAMRRIRRDLDGGRVDRQPKEETFGFGKLRTADSD